MTARHQTRGVTLVEVLVALAIFALVGGASLTVLRQLAVSTTAIKQETAALHDLSVALRLIELDLLQMEPGSLTLDSTRLSLRRMSKDRGLLPVTYDFADGRILRSIGAATGESGTEQVILRFVTGWDLRLYIPERGWSKGQNPTGQATARGLEITLQASIRRHGLRRVFPLLPKLP